MKSNFTSLILCLFFAATAWGHGPTPDQQLKQLHVRVLESAREVDMAFWIAAAAYLTAALACAVVCGLEARRDSRNMRFWFAAGFLMPILAAPAMILLQLKAAGRPIATGVSDE